MKVIAFNGSARKDGNTAIMARWVFEELEKEGIETELYQMVVPGSSYWNMGFGLEKGDVEKDEEAQGTMRTLGQNMAWLLKQIER